MRNRLLSASILLLGISSLSVQAQLAIPVSGNSKGLKDYYKNFFPIGVAVAPRDLSGEEAGLIIRQFTSRPRTGYSKTGRENR